MSKRKSDRASQVSKRVKRELPEQADSFWIIVAKAMARAGHRTTALMLLSTRKSFQTARRHVWMKYRFLWQIPPKKYFGKLSQLCVLRNLGFPMTALKSRDLALELKFHIEKTDFKDEWSNFGILHDLLCSNTADLESILRLVSRITSCFACDATHNEEDHFQSILVRVFSLATKMENWNFAQEIGSKIQPKAGALLAVYFQSVAMGEESNAWRDNFVKGILSLPNLAEHNENFIHVLPGHGLDFLALHEQIGRDGILSAKNKAIFFFSHLLGLFIDERMDEIISVFDKYANLYTNPSPPTIITFGRTLFGMTMLFFIPAVGRKIGTRWRDWLRDNAFAVQN